jgi:hypothetical protein
MRPSAARRRFVGPLSAGTVWTSLALVALYGAIGFARDRPQVAYPCFSLLGVLFIAAAVWDVRLRRRLRESQSLLAGLVCPACGTTFGSSAAHEAFNPLPPPRDMIVDDFGYASVTCPKCGADSMFHRNRRELVLLRPAQSDA